MALSDSRLKAMLGPVRPHVFTAAKDIANRFGTTRLLGVGLRANESYHPSGRAVDFMTPSKTTGDSLAAHVQANASAYGAIEIIWWQKIWTAERASQGWRPMESRGNDTANHKDHVHVSFNSSGGEGSVAQSQTGSSTGPCLLIFIVGMTGISGISVAVGALVKGLG